MPHGVDAAMKAEQATGVNAASHACRAHPCTHELCERDDAVLSASDPG